MDKQKFVVPAEFAGKRLDIFLTSALCLTRSQVQKMIKNGLVEVSGKKPSVHHWLKAGEEVVVGKREPSSVPPPAREPALSIVADTNDYVVVIKPAGVITHPATGTSAAALTAALTRRYPDIVSIGASGRPGIVHRLDRDVSGLLVVAKTQAMYDELQRQFKERLVKKRYKALVEGVVAKPEGVLQFAMARSKTYPGKMAARPKGEEGRAAETHFTVLKKFAHHTLLELELITGRTHQIRAHLKAYGHPIVGDTFYGTKKKSLAQQAVELKYPFLQATTLGFFDLKGQWQEYSLPLEPELQNFLNTLS